jgi:ABC-type lipoprotein release transport system permease subunit
VLRGIGAFSNFEPDVGLPIYAAGGLVVVAAAAAASLIPAMRATRLEPSSALRTD